MPIPTPPIVRPEDTVARMFFICSLLAMFRIDPGELATLLLTAPLGARIGLATHSETARQAAARALAESVVRRLDGALEVDRNQLRLPI